MGDWVEVVPEEGAGRTFVRASEVVTVQLIDDRDDDPQAVPNPLLVGAFDENSRYEARHAL